VEDDADAKGNASLDDLPKDGKPDGDQTPKTEDQENANPKVFTRRDLGRLKFRFRKKPMLLGQPKPVEKSSKDLVTAPKLETSQVIVVADTEDAEVEEISVVQEQPDNTAATEEAIPAARERRPSSPLSELDSDYESEVETTPDEDYASPTPPIVASLSVYMPPVPPTSDLRCTSAEDYVLAHLNDFAPCAYVDTFAWRQSHIQS